MSIQGFVETSRTELERQKVRLKTVPRGEKTKIQKMITALERAIDRAERRGLRE